MSARAAPQAGLPRLGVDPMIDDISEARVSSGPTDILLRDSPGSSFCLLGNPAMVRGALEAGVQFVSGYPGTPASEVGDSFARIARAAGIHFEYSVNEKVAVEIAFGACLTGARSLCSMKHLGLMYAGDPISTMPYVGVEGGMVIVSAGDPSCLTSPNEQDQRLLTKFLYFPVFDPSTPDDALRMTRYAFNFSEKARLPVIMRPTTRVCHTGGTVTFGALPKSRNTIEFKKNPSRHVPMPANARPMRISLSERIRQAEALLAESEFFPRFGEGRYGLIASGVAFAYASQAIESLGIQDRVSLLKIGAYPIPESRIVPFLRSVDEVLVLEELTPFVEEWVTLSAFRNNIRIPIHGKHDGYLPLEFEYTPELVEDALRKCLELPKATRLEVELPELPPRPPVLCPGCPHRSSFVHAHRVFGKKTVYINDIGCYSLGYGDPLDSCDALLCMGSSITQASGIARTTGQRTVAYIGDSTFFHSALPGLKNAVQADDNITVIVLNNYVTAMTGFQPSVASSEPASKASEAPKAEAAQTPSSTTEPIATWTKTLSNSIKGEATGPTAGSTETHEEGLSILRAVRGLGVKKVYLMDPFDEEGARKILKQAKSDVGLNVVISNAPCAVHAARAPGFVKAAPMHIDQEKCNACSLCVRTLGCPAIFVKDGEYFIDHTLCNGCELCADVCNREAIGHVGA